MFVCVNRERTYYNLCHEVTDNSKYSCNDWWNDISVYCEYCHHDDDRCRY